ncbi:adenylosuccinate synthetase [Myxococcus sp. K15C18031901]|uniref:adenylosuccinate synthetase n=1 Tax=Myxococcus dinghuensis TaxID=2906761 RepID=UPI0020A81883|nr:adenylosuccinate synthetase [Myxococcus dinghuensis]MCP3097470.1 adenylosuccinate synthetase [Myxococcus dinghuensis]
MSPARTAHVVVDLGFGDAGKGTLTDWLVRRHGAGLVVRFNGGAQAGHNVVTDDGRHHTFSQVGAGSFVAGVRTHLARTTVFHPLALRVEADFLAKQGVPDAMERVTVSEHARVITPFHQAVGRLRELARGERRHGTCGVGVGETVRDALANPTDIVFAGELAHPTALIRKARAAQERLRADVAALRPVLRRLPFAEREWMLLDDPEVVVRWADAVRALGPRRFVVEDAWLGHRLRASHHTVFEGAQGVLLDEWRGFHPHTTWSTCTFDPALELLREHGFEGEIRRLGVLRTYATRHGEGPLPTEEPALAPSVPEPHNDAGGWQGSFRVGHFDAVLARYALEVCGGVDTLALTHLDRLASRWPVSNSYRVPTTTSEDDAPLFLGSPDSGHVTGLRAGPREDLDWQARLTGFLSRCAPSREALDLGGTPAERTERFVAWVESALRVKVSVTSHGPAARDKRPRC